MPQTWQRMLEEYNYVRNLGDYAYNRDYPRHVRDWWETKAFEDLFRKYGQEDLRAWYAVVHWKSPRSEKKTISRIKSSGVNAEKLWILCTDYISNPSRDNFSRFRNNIAKASVVATAATFPAFICPEQFPMADSQIAEWARVNGEKHNLIAPNLKDGVLYERHWPFICAWMEWCQHTAGILTDHTGRHWRARDVEMAVFTAQRSSLTLNPLT